VLRSISQKKIEAAPKDLQSDLQREYLEDGPLQQVLADPQISEIIVSVHGIFCERAGVMSELKPGFLTELSRKRFLDRVLSEAQLKTDLNIPIANGKWRDFRVHFIDQPLSTQGPVLTLRRQSQNRFSLSCLHDSGMLSSQQKDHLEQMIAKKVSCLIVGATGSGKTTLVNALLQRVPVPERVVVLEDTDELAAPHQNCAKLLARCDSTTQLRNYDLGDLLRESLRMRPDRIVVGEVRGPEAKELLLALSTGHSGFLGTLHASSAREALWRLEMLVQMGAPQWAKETIRQLIFASLKQIVVVKRESGLRKISEIKTIAGLEANGLLLEDTLWD
jgi:pilus assembly protein CpaF